ncbi:hypothetical protein [Candidatus Electronema sp. JC]|uniref:hypothetical protein n=1 Tax=Candidatus Electronema sp. JC TaxID=3401570 RepID=UPI003B4355EF
MKNIILQDSKYQEQVIEYQFLSELMFSLSKHDKKLEIMRVHTDSFGYDLILKVDQSVRFIQLKSRHIEAVTQYWDVHKSLLENPNGRVVVILFNIKEDTIVLNYNFLPLQEYQSSIQKPPRYKKDAYIHCEVSYSKLDKNKTINELSQWLFFDSNYLR